MSATNTNPEDHHRQRTDQDQDQKVSDCPLVDTFADIEQFQSFYSALEADLARNVHDDRYKQLLVDFEECCQLKEHTDSIMSDLLALEEQVRSAERSLEPITRGTEFLLQERTAISSAVTTLNEKLNYFGELEALSKKLSNPSPLILGDMGSLLSRLDECIRFMTEHEADYREAGTYLASFRQLQIKSLAFLKSQIISFIQAAGRQVVEQSLLSANTAVPGAISSSPSDEADDVFSLFYGKFSVSAPRIKSLVGELERRSSSSELFSRYLEECLGTYFSTRESLIHPVLQMAIEDVFVAAGGDRSASSSSSSSAGGSSIPRMGQCGLVRDSTNMMMNICRDEYHLYFQFFTSHHQLFDDYLFTLCKKLYDRLRPAILHNNHLETLSELCIILKEDLVEDTIVSQSDDTKAFASTVDQLLKDIQERLVYRTNVYIQESILGYNPAGGDLAYPDKLVMMEQIAEGLKDTGMASSAANQVGGRGLKRSDSMDSLFSTVSDIAFIDAKGHTHSKIQFHSPADLHGMWYPTVRRTLLCLEKLYKSLDNPSFQWLSQEVLTACIQSLDSASRRIEERSSPMDGQLFLIKHLLILREQIAPFRIELTLRDVNLDLSRLKSAARDLINHKGDLLKFNTNNGLLKFIFEQAPGIIVEELINSQKTLDWRIRSTCELFIDRVHRSLSRPLTALNAHLRACGLISYSSSMSNGRPNGPKTMDYDLQRVHSLLAEQAEVLRADLPRIQRNMSLYLANRDTELILFRPVRDKMVRSYADVHKALNGVLRPLISGPPPPPPSDDSKSEIEPSPVPTSPTTASDAPEMDSKSKSEEEEVPPAAAAESKEDPKNTSNPSEAILWSLEEFLSLFDWPRPRGPSENS